MVAEPSRIRDIPPLPERSLMEVVRSSAASIKEAGGKVNTQALRREFGLEPQAPLPEELRKAFRRAIFEAGQTPPEAHNLRKERTI